MTLLNNAVHQLFSETFLRFHGNKLEEISPKYKLLRLVTTIISQLKTSKYKDIFRQCTEVHGNFFNILNTFSNNNKLYDSFKIEE